MSVVAGNAVCFDNESAHVSVEGHAPIKSGRNKPHLQNSQTKLDDSGFKLSAQTQHCSSSTSSFAFFLLDCPAFGIALPTMVPKPQGTSAATKSVTHRPLPPLPKLRVRRPNKPEMNPCLGVMASVLGAWSDCFNGIVTRCVVEFRAGCLFFDSIQAMVVKRIMTREVC